MAYLKPSPSGPMRFSAGTRQFSKLTMAVGWARQPILSSGLPNERPLAPFSTNSVETPFGAVLAGAAHDDIKIGEPGAGDERLRPVEHIMRIAIGLGAGAQRSGVGAGAGLGQAIGRDRLHAREFRQPAAALLLARRTRRSSTSTYCGSRRTRPWRCSRARVPRRSAPHRAGSGPSRRHPRAHKCRQSPVRPVRAARRGPSPLPPNGAALGRSRSCAKARAVSTIRVWSSVNCIICRLIADLIACSAAAPGFAGSVGQPLRVFVHAGISPAALLALAVLAGSAMDATIKRLAETNHVLLVVLGRYLFGALFSVAIWARAGAPPISAEMWRVHSLRGLHHRHQRRGFLLVLHRAAAGRGDHLFVRRRAGHSVCRSHHVGRAAARLESLAAGATGVCRRARGRSGRAEPGSIATARSRRRRGAGRRRCCLRWPWC